MGQAARLKEPIKILDHGNTLLGPHRMFTSRPFEADLHLDSDKAEKSKPPYENRKSQEEECGKLVGLST